MVREFTKERELVNRSFRFMKNFPFNDDFEITLHSQPMMAVMFDEEFDSEIRRPGKIVHFKYKDSPLRATIAITPVELAWLEKTADSIKKLDQISKKINRGLKTKDVLVKKAMSVEADEWLSQLADGNSTLSKETFNEVLKSLLGNRSVKQTVQFINTLNRLYSGKGLVRMTRDDLDVAFTYFHFRLIYAKLMLGIVIASKISI
jgi:hypothetical protein